MNLTLVIPTHNRHSDVAQLMNSIKAQVLDSLQIEVIVVSNLIDPELKAWLQNFQKSLSFPIQYFEAGKTGVNTARNLGLLKARSSKVYFLDDDVFLSNPHHLQTIFNMAQHNSWAAAIGGGYYLPGQVGLIDEVYHAICTSWLKEGFQNSGEMLYLVGGNTLYNLEVIQGDLKFNEQITFGGSETELNLRLHVQGNKFLFSDSLNLKHSTHLNIWTLSKKALRQGIGRSFHENVVLPTFWKVDTNDTKKFLTNKSNQKLNYFLATFYYSLYDFFFHVGYRHGKKENNGPLSKWTVIRCMSETFFQVNSDKILFVPNPNATPFHQKNIPSLKFKELHHWFKAHIWWKIPNYIFWKFIPFIGNKTLFLLEKFLPGKTLKIRNLYFRVFKKL